MAKAADRGLPPSCFRATAQPLCFGIEHSPAGVHKSGIVRATVREEQPVREAWLYMEIVKML
jgi:hypothetical protein